MIGEIFKSSTCVMSQGPLAAGELFPAWDTLLTNRILVVLAVVFVLMSLPNLFRVFPSLVDCFRRSRGNVSLEHSVNLSHMRNLCSLAAALPLCLAVSRFGLASPRFFSLVDPLWHSLMVMGILLVFLLLRHLLFIFFKPYKLSSENSDIVHHVLYTFNIILVIMMLSTIAVMLVLGTAEDVVRKVLLWEMAGVWFLSLVREGQIFASYIRGFSTFLYLCAFELLPVAVLVVCMVML